MIWWRWWRRKRKWWENYYKNDKDDDDDEIWWKKLNYMITWMIFVSLSYRSFDLILSDQVEDLGNRSWDHSYYLLSIVTWISNVNFMIQGSEWRERIDREKNFHINDCDDSVGGVEMINMIFYLTKFSWVNDDNTIIVFNLHIFHPL